MESPDNKPAMTKHTFVIKGGKWWTLSQSMYDDLKETYPLHDIDTCLREAAGWCKMNNRRRKTARGMGKFLFGWIGRAEETGLVTDAPTYDRSKVVHNNNIRTYKDQYLSWLSTKSVADIKANPTFMGLCRQEPELREWALSLRPDLKSEKPPVDADLPPPTDHIVDANKKVESKRERRVRITEQYYKDVVEYQIKTNNFC